jgi:hypothetical protein
VAAVTHAITTPDAGNTPNLSGAFTPAANDLLIVFLAVEGSLDDPGNLTSSVGGQTFAQVRRQLYQSSSAAAYVFVANALATAVSHNLTTTPTDAGTGSNISVYRVSGMTRAGTAAIRQSGGQSNQTGSTTPAPAFGVAALTGNPCLGAVFNATNPAGLTAPSGWTESQDTGYTTGQVNGIETAFRDSGETGTTITWGSTSPSAFASLIVELDTTALPEPIPDVVYAPPRPA